MNNDTYGQVGVRLDVMTKQMHFGIREIIDKYFGDQQKAIHAMVEKELRNDKVVELINEYVSQTVIDVVHQIVESHFKYGDGFKLIQETINKHLPQPKEKREKKWTLTHNL